MALEVVVGQGGGGRGGSDVRIGFDLVVDKYYRSAIGRSFTLDTRINTVTTELSSLANSEEARTIVSRSCGTKRCVPSRFSNERPLQGTSQPRAQRERKKKTKIRGVIRGRERAGGNVNGIMKRESKRTRGYRSSNRGWGKRGRGRERQEEAQAPFGCACCCCCCF